MTTIIPRGYINTKSSQGDYFYECGSVQGDSGCPRLGGRALAANAKVSPNTITSLERGEKLQERTVDNIRAALESAGIEFLDPNGGGPGVRLRDLSKD